MDWLEFTSKTIGELAWPAVAVYVLVTQKRGIDALLTRMSKLKAGGLEAEFSAKTESTAAKIEVLEARPVEAPKLDAEAIRPPVAQARGPGDPHAAGTAGTPPALAGGTQLLFRSYLAESQQQREMRLRDERLRASGLIIEEWTDLEDTVRHLAASHGLAKSGQIAAILAELQKLGVLSAQTVAIVKELANLRNQVAHARFEPTEAAGDQYADSCRKIEKRIGEEEAAWQEAAASLNGPSHAAVAPTP
ncbi:hypothetical protein [Scleromatobacter humisilvae]|uniref:DUF4145 domain-containing protein n=1 Tax=Scleromatobacter humisilvae TaxID=2897159 RepID=A0A9X1YIF9_9BURK|nr:hypothetical protein [Scleromatobacter humisilvae]MCK9685995.1 hypothetical protein [Scleromatobacter humisilvae]